MKIKKIKEVDLMDLDIERLDVVIEVEFEYRETILKLIEKYNDIFKIIKSTGLYAKTNDSESIGKYRGDYERDDLILKINEDGISLIVYADEAMIDYKLVQLFKLDKNDNKVYNVKDCEFIDSYSRIEDILIDLITKSFNLSKDIFF